MVKWIAMNIISVLRMFFEYIRFSDTPVTIHESSYDACTYMVQIELIVREYNRNNLIRLQ